MMHVVVNALPLRHGGGVTYVQHELTELAQMAPDLRLHTLVSPWSSLSGLPGRMETVQVRRVASRFVFEQTRLPLRKADLLYCPANFGPMVAQAPIVLTIQNANYYRAAKALDETRPSRPPWKVLANHMAMRRADVVVAVSRSLADDALEAVPGIRTKLTVIQGGAPTWPAESTPIMGVPSDYLLSVASAAPHKHVDDVVRGWARSQDDGAERVALVLVGGHSSEQESRHRAIAGRHARRVVHLGRIQRRGEIKWLYEHARALVLMSRLESFSLAPLEAGSLGCGLVLSDLPVHREVAGDHAVYVPCGDAAALAGVLAEEVVSWTPGSRRWEWDQTWRSHAEQLYRVFESVAGR
jgi:glycosyltransferase involved in cell wall biosynthesis